MRILIEELADGEEEQIIIRCRELSDDVMRLIRALKRKEQAFIGYEQGQISRVFPRDIYYFEAVDNKVFLYSKELVLEVKQKLYEIEELTAPGDFLRVSKSTILNISKVKRLRPALSGRLEAELDNNEKIMISRQYVPNLKKKLGI